MFVNQRKMMRTRKNSQLRHQQKTYQNKGEFFKETRTLKSQLTLTKTEEMKELEKSLFSHQFQELENLSVSPQDPQYFDDSYSDGQINLPTFVSDHFSLTMDQVSEDSARCREEAASNSVIVQKILEHANFYTLKTARLVCKEWKTLANFELGRRNCCCMNFEWNFLLKKNLSVLRNSADLFWVEFDFFNLDETVFEYMTTFCGSQIKMLKIHPKDFPLINTFFNAGKFPNLKSLSFIEDFEYELSRIVISVGDPLAREVWNLLKLLREESNSNSAISQVQVKAQPKLQLERLVIGNQDFENRPEFVDQINQILKSSQKSLKFLDIPSAFCSDSTLRLGIPGKLSQLSTVHFQINCVESDKIKSEQFQLPRGFKQENLPNLKTVRFEFNHDDSLFPWSSWEFLAPPKIRKESCLRSVVNLEIGYKCDPVGSMFSLLPFHWFPWISALFRNIRNLILDNWKNVDAVLRHVYIVWPNLISLEIRSPFWSQRDSKDNNLDSVLTGLPEEKCDELRKKQEPVPMSTEIEEMKTWPNLNSLKGLKRLDISVFKSSRRLFCPVSKISSLYAFDLNPELRVRVHHFPEKFDK